jgi:hypothetical protein
MLCSAAEVVGLEAVLDVDPDCQAPLRLFVDRVLVDRVIGG